MSHAAVEALRADHASLAELAATFTSEEWATESACTGWSVKDLVGHMTQVFRQVVDPASLPAPDPSGQTERTQDRWVEALRDTPVDQVLAEYQSLGTQAIEAMVGLQGVDSTMDLGDLGTYPLHRIVNAFAFDHYTHIRVDLLASTGPVDRPAPETTEGHLDAVAEWIVAGIPQMAPACLVQPVDLVLSGPAGRTERLGTGEAVATVTSSIEDLIRWSTRRASWRDMDVQLEGDLDAAAHFCDTVHVF